MHEMKPAVYEMKTAVSTPENELGVVLETMLSLKDHFKARETRESTVEGLVRDESDKMERLYGVVEDFTGTFSDQFAWVTNMVDS